MKNYNFEQEFIDAVNKNDIPYLRTFIASEIRVDPAFNQAKCDDCMSYIREHGLNITEAFKLNVSEAPTPTNQNEWTKDLFHKKVEYLRLNFAYDERVSELREISRVAYADQIKKETPISSFKEAPKGRRSNTKKTSQVKKIFAKMPFLLKIIAAIAAVAVAVVVAIAAIKVLFRAIIFLGHAVMALVSLFRK